MKNPFIYLLIMAFICACDKMSNEDGMSSVVSTRLRVVIVDEALNDRLNPESAGYWGNEFTQNIQVVHGGFEGVFDDDGDNCRYVTRIQGKPVSEPDGYSKGKYFIWCADGITPLIYAEDSEDPNLLKDFVFTHITYPDGAKDEIKVQYI